MEFLEYSLLGPYPYTCRTHQFPTAETSQRVPERSQSTYLRVIQESCHCLPLILSHFNGDFLVLVSFPVLISHHCDKAPDITT